jgi:predicted nucleic acid-binding protein
MIAVADTSPICYLILIGEIDLLPKLFSQVLVTLPPLAACGSLGYWVFWARLPLGGWLN